jgi:hypothetical protein
MLQSIHDTGWVALDRSHFGAEAQYKAANGSYGQAAEKSKNAICHGVSAKS